MKKLSDVLTFVQAGGRPIVTFNEAISHCEAYAEAGMKARIVGAHQNEVDVLLFNLDYSEFDEHNKAIESHNYYDKSGNATLTARESGYYTPVEDVYLTPTDDTEAVFSVATAASAQLFEEFTKAKAAYSRDSYVTWLEKALVEARANPRPAQTARDRQSEAMAIGGEAFGGLVEYYPSVLTAARRTDTVLSAVRWIQSREQHGGREPDYESLKDAIEFGAKQAQATLNDWRDLAGEACDDLFAYYPRVLTEEGRGEFVDRALAQLVGTHPFPELRDRDEWSTKLKDCIGADALAAQRQLARAESPAN